MTRSVTEIDGVGPVESWEELVAVDGSLVTFRSMTVFHHEGLSIESMSTLRFRTRTETEESVSTAGFDLFDVRDAPDRPGREFVFVCRRPFPKRAAAQTHVHMCRGESVDG